MSEEAATDNAGGGSILTEGVAPGSEETVVTGAGGADTTTRIDTADAAREAVLNGPPEGIPEKFWDHEKGVVKTEDMAQSYVNLEKLVSSTEKVIPPLSDDDAEGHERWAVANGRPESAEDYEIAELPVMPEGVEYDKAGEERLRAYAHANGLNQRQFDNFYNDEVKVRIEAHAEYAKAQADARAELERGLKREYGNSYDAELGVSKNAFSKYADPDFALFMDETGLGNDPRMIRVFNKIGKDLGGETKLTGKPQVAEFNSDDAKASIALFRERNNKALMDAAHPEHARISKELSSMYDDLHGTGPANG